MKKLSSVLGMTALLMAVACGGGEQAGDGMMDDSEPSQGMDGGAMMADTVAADSMVSDTMMDEGMPEEMMDEDSMSGDEMGGGR